MPPPYRIQVRVQGVIQRYSYMQTTRYIKRGEEIIQEKPLTDLPLSLTQLMMKPLSWFWVRNAMACKLFKIGMMQCQHLIKSVSCVSIMHMQASYKPAMTSSVASKLNAFMEEEKMQGHDFQVLMIYDKISKVNHACRPNAVLSYDPGTKMGSLRALSNIDRDQEIFINYRSSEEFTFSDEVARSRTPTKRLRLQLPVSGLLTDRYRTHPGPQHSRACKNLLRSNHSTFAKPRR